MIGSSGNSGFENTSDVLQLQLQPSPQQEANSNQLIITTNPNGQREAKVFLPPNTNWGPSSKPVQQVSSGAPVSAILPPAPAHPPVRRLDSTVDLPSSNAVPEAVPIPTKKTVERTSVPKFNGQPDSNPPVNRATERLKSHEDLRRRASYQKVFKDVINASESPLAESNSFQRPLPASQSSHPSPHSQAQGEPYTKIKQEAPQTNHPSHPSTDDSEDERMSPNQTPVVQIATAPSDIQSSQPVLVQLSQPNTPNISQYSNVNSLQNPIGLPSYSDLPSSAPLTSCLVPYAKFQGDIDDRSDQGQMDRDGLMEGPVAMVEEAARKREVRLLKNREAARECRRKKKEYIKCLENRVQVLESQNKALIDELKNLKEMYCITKQ